MSQILIQLEFRHFQPLTNVCTVKNRSRLQNDPFRTISSLFFSANYMYIFHKNQLQKVILKCLTCLNLNWIKGYNIKYKKSNFLLFFQFVKKKPENLQLKNGHFMTLSGHFFANYTKIFQKTEIQTVILRCLVGLNLN